MTGRVSWWSMLAILVIAPALRGGEAAKSPPTQEKPPSRAETYQAILKEYDTAFQAYSSAFRRAKTNEERTEAFKKAPKVQDFAGRFLDLAKADPKDSVGFDALLWIVQKGSGTPASETAVELLMENYLGSGKLATLFQRQTTILSPAMEKLARAILEKSPDNGVKRGACLALAMGFKNRRQNDEAEKFFQRFVDEFADMDGLFQIVQLNASGPSGVKAIDRLIEKHTKDPGFVTGLRRIGSARQPSPALEKFFRTVMEKSDQRAAKGNATFLLAQYLKNQSQLAARLKDADEKMLKTYESAYGTDAVQGLRTKEPKSFEAEIEKLLDKVVTDYGDVSGTRGTLGSAAEPELYEIRFLSVGKEVPDIEAEDIDGVKFKLSDYRGKVVMLDFWGHW